MVSALKVFLAFLCFPFFLFGIQKSVCVCVCVCVWGGGGGGAAWLPRPPSAAGPDVIVKGIKKILSNSLPHMGNNETGL